MFRVSPVGVIETTVPNQGLTVACRGNYLAATHPRRTHIGWWIFTDQYDDSAPSESSDDFQWPAFPPPLQTLCGHNGAIKALAFNKDNELLSSMGAKRKDNNDETIRRPQSILLCSVDDYEFIVWDLLKNCFPDKKTQSTESVINDDNATATVNDFMMTSGSLLPPNKIGGIKNKETVSHCCFSWDERYIAVCRGSDIILILLETHNDPNPIHVLKGHNSCINSAEFSPHKPTWLVSVADDCTFIVWDVAATSGTNILQRSYLPSSTAVPLVVAMDFVREYVSIATADGHLLLLGVSCAISPTFQVVHTIDCSRLMQKENSNPKTISACHSALNTVDSGCVILSVSYFDSKQFFPQPRRKAPENAYFSQESSFFENLNDSLFLFVGTNNAIFCLNAFTLECVSAINLVLYQNTLLGNFKTLSLMLMTPEFKKWAVNCVTANYSNNAIHITKLSLSKQMSLDEDMFFYFSQQLVCPSTKLSENSILKSLPDAKCLKKANSKTTNLAKDKNISCQIKTDKPLTFKNNVKSSGYSTAPTNCTLFKPNTKATKTCLKTKCQARITSVQYDPTKVVHCKSQQQLSDNVTTAITNISFSSDGRNLAVALTDGTAMILKRSLTNKPVLFLGHKSSLNSVSLSHNGQWLLTASNDKTAGIWGANNTNSLMTFEKISHNFHSKHFSVKKKSECFENGITTSQFYYMDNFVLLASGRSFHLYNYNIDCVKDDIKSYLNKSQYKLVKKFDVDCNLVTDLAAINFFYSYIVLCCTSDRSLCVYDMNIGKRVLTIEATHPTAPHSVVMNVGSACLSLPANGYDLVLTAATTKGIKLWDLRSGQCVRQLDTHHNRSHRCRPAFSPCGKYVLATSENNTAYLYDIGKGVHCKQLLRHSDIVTDVVYNPMLPQVITATLDGKLYSFYDGEIK